MNKSISLNEINSLMTKLQVEFKIRSQEILDYFTSSFLSTSSSKSKFIVFAHYRTGSTLLCDLLQSHPDISMGGEILSPFANSYLKKILFPQAYLDTQAQKYPSKFYGFNLKIDQLILSLSRFHQKPVDFLENLSNHDWKIIYLKRNNILRKAISDICANTRKQWQDRSENPLIKKPIYLDCQKLIRVLESEEKMRRKEQEVIQKVSCLQLVYETHLLSADQHQATLDQVFSYLGIDSVQVKTNIRKISNHNLALDIENYEQVVDFIQDTKYKKFLELN